MPQGRRTAWIKRSALALALIAAAVGFTIAMWPKPVQVDLAAIGRGPLEVTIDEEGKTQIRDVYVVSAPITGRLPRSPLHVGDAVVAGSTLLAGIVPSAPAFLDVRTRKELEAQVAAAEAAVALAEAELRQAKAQETLSRSDLDRARKLARQGFLAGTSLDHAETDAKVKQDASKRAESSLQMRQKELASASARLMEPVRQGLDGRDPGLQTPPVEVRAPVTGRVLKLMVESEQDVLVGSPLLEVGDPGDLEIIVDLLSQDAVRVHVGDMATIEGWGGEQGLPAIVRKIDPIGFTKVSALGIEEQRVRTTLDFTGAAATHAALGHDFRVFVRIVVWRSASALRVPLGALFRDQDRWAVFRDVGGRARLTHVDLGHRNSEAAEVIDGLSEGDEVVLHPSDLIADQARITPRS